MRPPTIEDIVKATAEVYGVDPSFILQDTRKKEVIKLRHVAQYLCRRFTTATYERIGEEIAGRDHATALHAFKKIEYEYTTNLRMFNEVTYFINRVLEHLTEQGFALEEVIRSTDVAWYKGGENYKTA